MRWIKWNSNKFSIQFDFWRWDVLAMWLSVPLTVCSFEILSKKKKWYQSKEPHILRPIRWRNQAIKPYNLFDFGFQSVRSFHPFFFYSLLYSCHILIRALSVSGDRIHLYMMSIWTILLVIVEGACARSEREK